jgi:hypothetical protein
MGLQVPSDDGYPDIPFPSEKGALMVDLFRSAGWKGEELCSLNRVRLHLQMPFVSDVVLANGCKVSSSYDFPREDGQGGQIFGQAPRSTTSSFLTRLVIGLLPPIARGFGITT